MRPRFRPSVDEETGEVRAIDRVTFLFGMALGALAASLFFILILVVALASAFAMSREDEGVSALPPCTDAIADARGMCEGPLLIEPCETEDSTGCYWDADTMGNGTGVDVVNFNEED